MVTERETESSVLGSSSSRRDYWKREVVGRDLAESGQSDSDRKRLFSGWAEPAGRYRLLGVYCILYVHTRLRSEVVLY